MKKTTVEEGWREFKPQEWWREMEAELRRRGKGDHWWQGEENIETLAGSVPVEMVVAGLKYGGVWVEKLRKQMGRDEEDTTWELQQRCDSEQPCFRPEHCYLRRKRDGEEWDRGLEAYRLLEVNRWTVEKNHAVVFAGSRCQRLKRKDEWLAEGEVGWPPGRLSTNSLRVCRERVEWTEERLCREAERLAAGCPLSRKMKARRICGDDRCAQVKHIRILYQAPPPPVTPTTFDPRVLEELQDEMDELERLEHSGEKTGKEIPEDDEEDVCFHPESSAQSLEQTTVETTVEIPQEACSLSKESSPQSLEETAKEILEDACFHPESLHPTSSLEEKLGPILEEEKQTKEKITSAGNNISVEATMNERKTGKRLLEPLDRPTHSIPRYRPAVKPTQETKAVDAIQPPVQIPPTPEQTASAPKSDSAVPQEEGSSVLEKAPVVVFASTIPVAADDCTTLSSPKSDTTATTNHLASGPIHPQQNYRTTNGECGEEVCKSSSRPLPAQMTVLLKDVLQQKGESVPAQEGDGKKSSPSKRARKTPKLNKEQIMKTKTQKVRDENGVVHRDFQHRREGAKPSKDMYSNGRQTTCQIGVYELIKNVKIGADQEVVAQCKRPLCVLEEHLVLQLRKRKKILTPPIAPPARVEQTLTSFDLTHEPSEQSFHFKFDPQHLSSSIHEQDGFLVLKFQPNVQ